ncbi:MAG: DUF4340 domain-containing protein [Verrucomicrobiota bacterium]
MNKRQVIVLWIIAVALCAAVAIVRISSKPSNSAVTERTPGQTLFAGFPAKEIDKIRIEGAEEPITIHRKDGKWLVTERDNYPADQGTVNEFIRTLNDVEVTRGIEAGPSFAPRFGMDESAKSAEDRGLNAVFFDADGKELARVSLGKNIVSEGADPMAAMGGGTAGRYIRNHADDSGVYVTAETFSEVTGAAAGWLDSAFINPEKIQAISVTEAGKDEIEWKVVRDQEDAKFKLADAKPEEVLNEAAAAPLGEVFAYARFDDVVPAASIAEKVDAAKKRTVVIDTFEGFKYTLGISPAKTPEKKEGEAAPEAAPEADASVMYLTVNVAAEIPKERKKAEGEKPEEAKAKDDAFSTRSRALTDKLAKEKPLSGRTFAINRSSVEPLLRSRADLTAKARQTPGAGAAGGAQGFPGGAVITPPLMPGGGAATPPVEVPEEDGEGE